MYTCPRNRTFAFNDHVCMEMLFGVPDEGRTGRLVQVRKGCGAFGSDIYVVRLRNGELRSFENVMIRMANDASFDRAFYINNGKIPPSIPPQDPYPDDTEDTEYWIRNEYPETGFVIEHPKQPESPQQSFTMITLTMNKDKQ